MTQDKQRKKAVRERMAETGEPYTEAARHVADAPAETKEAVPAGAQANAPSAPRPAPRQVQFDDDDLDIPDFLK